MFDLDGTLWNATVPTARAWNEILESDGIPFAVITPDDVARVTGLPHDEAIRRAFPGVSPSQLETLITRTLIEDGEMIARTGAPVYEGVAEGLAELAQTRKLFVVSNCQTGYIETFFETSGLGHLFTDRECFGKTGRPKGENLKMVIERNQLESAVMVGDTNGDEEAARYCGVPFVFVGYGFGQADSPDFAFENFSELVEAARN